MKNSNMGGGMPHSLLEKEIPHIMNQSQLVQSTKENDMSSCFGGSSTTNHNNTTNNATNH